MASQRISTACAIVTELYLTSPKADTGDRGAVNTGRSGACCSKRKQGRCRQQALVQNPPVNSP